MTWYATLSVFAIQADLLKKMIINRILHGLEIKHLEEQASVYKI